MNEADLEHLAGGPEKMVTILYTINGRENPIVVLESTLNKFKQIGYEVFKKRNEKLKPEDFKYGNYLDELYGKFGFDPKVNLIEKVVRDYEESET